MLFGDEEIRLKGEETKRAVQVSAERVSMMLYDVKGISAKRGILTLTLSEADFIAAAKYLGYNV